VKYDPDSRTLRFASENEVLQFHSQLTDLIREAMQTAGEGAAGHDEVVERSREVMRERAVLMRALNALRRFLPRQGG